MAIQKWPPFFPTGGDQKLKQLIWAENQERRNQQDGVEGVDPRAPAQHVPEPIRRPCNLTGSWSTRRSMKNKRGKRWNRPAIGPKGDASNHQKQKYREPRDQVWRWCCRMFSSFGSFNSLEKSTNPETETLAFATHVG